MTCARAVAALLVVMAAGLVPVLVRAQSTTGDADQAYRQGTALLASGRHREALSYFDEAIRLDPRHPGAYNHRGFAHYELGQPERAMKDFDEAIQLDPRLTEAYNNRGIVYTALAQHPGARSRTSIRRSASTRALPRRTATEAAPTACSGSGSVPSTTTATPSASIRGSRGPTRGGAYRSSTSTETPRRRPISRRPSASDAAKRSWRPEKQ